MQKLTYRITTESPILFALNVGDANMVSTREYIRAVSSWDSLQTNTFGKTTSQTPTQTATFTGGF